MTELGVKIPIILDQTFQSKRRSGDAAHEIPAHLVEDVADFRIELKQTIKQRSRLPLPVVPPAASIRSSSDFPHQHGDICGKVLLGS